MSFDANGGTDAPNSQKKTHGQNLILTVAIPTRPNHVFLGWATDSTSKSVVYAPGATYTAEEDVTLYAVWQERKAIVDDKSRYTDWSTREDIKANLQVDLILLLDEFDYPPVTIDDVYKEVLEQAENFKKYM